MNKLRVFPYKYNLKLLLYYLQLMTLILAVNPHRYSLEPYIDR